METIKKGMSEEHKLLQDTAINWLYCKGCSVFAKEVPTQNGNADALGIITREKHTVYYVEAKVSRSDLICQKQKLVYETSVGNIPKRCWYPSFKGQGYEERQKEIHTCENCNKILKSLGDTGIDFYYLIVADGVQVEPTLYPQWGVLNQNGKVIRRAKRMKNETDSKHLLTNIANTLVYKC